MEARPLAELAVPGLERLGGARRRRRWRRPGPGSPPSSRRRCPRNARWNELGRRTRSPFADARRRPGRGCAGRCRSSRPSRGPRRRSRRSGAWRSSSATRCCQPGSSVANQSGSIGWLLRTSIDDGVRWNTYSSPASRARCGMHCTAVAPVPMMPTRLSAELGHRRAGRVAAGVVVVPAAGVEAVAGEGLDARDAGQLRPVQRTGAHGDEPGADLVAAVGADDPARRRRRPTRASVTSVEKQRVVVEAELRGDALAVLEDLGRHARTSASACGRSLRAAAGRSSPRCRTSRPGSGSSTRCRRRRRRPR